MHAAEEKNELGSAPKGRVSTDLEMWWATVKRLVRRSGTNTGTSPARLHAVCIANMETGDQTLLIALMNNINCIPPCKACTDKAQALKSNLACQGYIRKEHTVVL